MYVKNRQKSFTLFVNIFHNFLLILQIVFLFDAPFFTTWFCTNWTILYFPAFFLHKIIKNNFKIPYGVFFEIFESLQEKCLGRGCLMLRIALFSSLWVTTNYMYINSLRILLSTEVIALYATNEACVYLLSWILLHKQFDGIKVS